jgi:quinol monooxygenase YgiN
MGNDEVDVDQGLVRYQVFAALKAPRPDVEQFAVEATKTVKENEPGALSYEWHIDDDSESCVIEESYIDHATFGAHMTEFRRSGQMRALGGLLRVERVIVLNGERHAVREAFGPLETAFYRTVAAL